MKNFQELTIKEMSKVIGGIGDDLDISEDYISHKVYYATKICQTTQEANA